jgi:hypothetical protein
MRARVREEACMVFLLVFDTVTCKVSSKSTSRPLDSVILWQPQQPNFTFLAVGSGQILLASQRRCPHGVAGSRGHSARLPCRRAQLSLPHRGNLIPKALDLGFKQIQELDATICRPRNPNPKLENFKLHSPHIPSITHSIPKILGLGPGHDGSIP